MKKILSISLLGFLLSGCATTMTPEQHNMFARDYALLNICAEQGLIDPNLAANGLYLYQDRLSNYKADLNLINQQIGQYYQHRGSVSSEHCNYYAVQLHSELIQKQKAEQEMQEFNRAMEAFNESMERSQERSLRLIESINNSSGYKPFNPNGFGGF